MRYKDKDKEKRQKKKEKHNTNQLVVQNILLISGDNLKFEKEKTKS